GGARRPGAPGRPGKRGDGAPPPPPAPARAPPGTRLSALPSFVASSSEEHPPPAEAAPRGRRPGPPSRAGPARRAPAPCTRPTRASAPTLAQRGERLAGFAAQPGVTRTSIGKN